MILVYSRFAEYEPSDSERPLKTPCLVKRDDVPESAKTAQETATIPRPLMDGAQETNESNV